MVVLNTSGSGGLEGSVFSGFNCSLGPVKPGIGNRVSCGPNGPRLGSGHTVFESVIQCYHKTY